MRDRYYGVGPLPPVGRPNAPYPIFMRLLADLRRSSYRIGEAAGGTPESSSAYQSAEAAQSALVDLFVEIEERARKADI